MSRERVSRNLLSEQFHVSTSWASDSFCVWEANGRTSERPSKADQATHFYSIFWGKDVRLKRPVRGRPDIQNGVKKHL